jgi:hypothetical protein
MKIKVKENLFGEKTSVTKSMEKCEKELKKPESPKPSLEMAQRYQAAYLKVLEQQPFWKKSSIIENSGQKDRVVSEFCKQVIELAESDMQIN